MGSVEPQEPGFEPFEPLAPFELDRLGDEELADYVARAREQGDLGAAKDASGVLVNRFWDVIGGWVRAKVPERDVEDVRGEVVLSVMKRTFDGQVLGEFAGFLRTITRRRVADYHDARSRRLEADPLAEENEDDEPLWGEQPSSEDRNATLGTRDAIDRVLATLSEVHRLVVRLYGPNEAGYMSLSAAETVAQVNAEHPEAKMSEDNVFQIWKRFKAKLKAELDG